MRRHGLAILAATLPLLVTAAFAPQPGRAASPSAGPAAPTALAVTPASSTHPLARGGWIARGQVHLEFQVQVDGGSVTPQVEIEPYATPFTGTENATGVPVTASGKASVTVNGLVNGIRYHWQARVVDDSGLPSDWVPFATVPTTFDFGVDTTSPSRPVLSSPTDPRPSRWYNNRSVLIHWSSHDDLSGIRGYTYGMQRQPHVIAPGPITASTSIRLDNLADGTWFVAVRSVNGAGTWSPTATFKLQLDHQAPQVTWLSPARFTFNPYRGPSSMQFRVNEDASVTLTLYRVGSNRPVDRFAYRHVLAGRTMTVRWSGKDAQGRMAPRGYYFFDVRAVDRATNMRALHLGGIDLNPQPGVRAPTGQLLYPGDGKRIFVSLSRQTLYAYDGVHLVVQTLVTTGNPSLPTPPGSYTVLAKYHPYEFISPWPPGSPYYYAPSLSQYALLFRDGGYFLHDAPWRSNFGPGSNGPGQPGSNYGGTHGCVNIPSGPMVTLFAWAPVGTPVDVVP